MRTIEKEGWQFGVVKKLNFSVMDAYEIIGIKEERLEVVGGPYLTEDEGWKDMEAATEKFLEKVVA